VSKKGWIIFVVVVLGLLVSLVAWKSSTTIQVDVSSVDQNKVQSASNENGSIADHVFGSTQNKVILVEYGDIQCPACGSAHPQVKTISEQYKSQLTFVFRNFPLSSIHPNARAAAGAVEAAGLQGKYWEMQNLMYESQSEWSNLTGSERDAQFVTYAKQLGLDEAKFNTDLVSESIKLKLAFDKALSNKVGIDSTPTFFLNGVKVDSDVIQDLQQSKGDKLRALINTDLTAAGIPLPSITQ
jgi:protein-disulfide isomerase